MSEPRKVDLFRELKAEYAQPKVPTVLRTTPGRYLAIEGRAAPGTDDFQDRIGALYSVAYTVKMTRKFGGRRDYTVGKLETQYAEPDGPMEDLWWRMLIRTPDFVAEAELEHAATVLIEKGKTEAVRDVALHAIDEGDCVQMLHVGPYDAADGTRAAMLAFAEEEGLEAHGLYHEIYLSDPRRVPPERLKTILRFPVRDQPSR
jgi:hypothetical protein